MDEAMEKAGNFLERVERPKKNALAGFSPNVVTMTAPASVAAEQYRVLYHRLERMRALRPMKIICFTSAVSGEGKSMTVANTALVAAAMNPDKRVLLIDADLRRPKLNVLLGVDGRPGLGEYLSGDASSAEIVKRVGSSRLSIIPAGQPRNDAADLLCQGGMRTLLDQARQSFDEIYVDAPPTLPVADGALLCGMSDGAVLVVRAGNTSRVLVNQALEALKGLPMLGCVLNGVEFGEVPYLSRGGKK